MEPLNKKLKELRKEKGITQKEIASSLKISQTGYAGYEQGYREPDLTTLKKICLYFDVTADYLIGLEDESGAKTNSKYNIGTINNSNINMR